MTTQVIINGKEVTNPFAKAGLAFVAILIAALVTSVVVFVLLPIIGVAVTLSVGLIAIFLVSTIMGIMALAFGAVLLGWLFGSTEIRVQRIHKQK